MVDVSSWDPGAIHPHRGPVTCRRCLKRKDCPLIGDLVAHTFGLRAPYPVAETLRGIALLAALPILIRAMRD
ncbi:hypothetical protein ACWDWV_38205 [Streptosporangium sandarakinum]